MAISTIPIDKTKTSISCSLGGTIYIYRDGDYVNIVTPQISSLSFAAYETKNMGTLPAGCRPSVPDGNIAFPMPTGATGIVLRLLINNNGQISLYNSGSALSDITIIRSSFNFYRGG